MKKLLLISTLAFSFLLVVGCGKKTENITTDTTTQVQNTDKKEATKDQCFDLMELAAKAAVLQSKWETASATVLADEAMNLEKKMIADNVEYESTCEKYMTDMNFIKEIQKRVAEME